MLAYSYLIKSYHPVDFKACATSAMREARNGNAIVKQIADQAGLRIEIIDGKREAEIIYANHIADMLHPKKNYLYIDVGGGSTELTLMVKSQGVASHSFNLGTVRMLQGRVEQSEWQKMQDWLENLSKAYANIEGIGSGGSINKIFKMSRKKAEQPLSYKELKAISKLLASYTYHERIQILGLRPDRADVIIPASKIYLSAMQYAKIKKMHVPQVGLADGIVHLLYEEQKRQHSSVQPYHSSSS
jgi:exopolyphosphatase/guanosine-5'-triphosphate,3'-diphosphate pyrophosphatase